MVLVSHVPLPFSTPVQRAPGDHNHTLFYGILCYFLISSHVNRLSMETSPISWSEYNPHSLYPVPLPRPSLRYLFLLLLIHSARKVDYKFRWSCYKYAVKKRSGEESLQF